MTTGDKIKIDGKDCGEVVRVLKNGKIVVSFWVQTSFMRHPELWRETFRAERIIPCA